VVGADRVGHQLLRPLQDTLRGGAIVHARYREHVSVEEDITEYGAHPWIGRRVPACAPAG
jgi:hypothetical protein